MRTICHTVQEAGGIGESLFLSVYDWIWKSIVPQGSFTSAAANQYRNPDLDGNGTIALDNVVFTDFQRAHWSTEKLNGSIRRGSRL